MFSYLFQIEEVWKKSFGSMSFAITKDLPYFKFIEKAIIKMFRNGQFLRLKKKWADSKIECSPQIKQGVPLTFEKVVSLFMIFALGAILGLLIMVYEKYSTKQKTSLKQNYLEDEKEEWEFLKIICDIVKSKIDKNKACPNESQLLLLEDLAQKLKSNK